jgi:hypothetical protein
VELGDPGARPIRPIPIRRFRAVLESSETSEEEGFRGRVGLHALPQAEQFYERGCGMTAVGPDPTKQNLLYFELTSERASELLQREQKQ